MRHISTLIIAVVTLLTACGKQGADSSAAGQLSASAVDTTCLRVAVMPTLDCLPLYVARERGLFDKAGVEVTLVDCQAQMDQDTALLGGSVDGAMTDLVRSRQMQRQGLPLHHAAATAAHWQLLTLDTAQITTPQLLANKIVAMSRYSATDLLADMVITQGGHDSTTVFKVQFNSIEVRLNMLLNHMIDAVILPEPQATVARMQNSPVLADTRKRDMVLGVLAFRQTTMDSPRRSRQVEHLLTAYDEACDSLNKYGLKAYRQVIEQCCHISSAVVDQLPGDYRYEYAQPPRPVDEQRARTWLNHNN